MKITRRQLRRLISEAARTILVDPEGNATPSDVAFRKGRNKDAAYAGLHPKLADLMGLNDHGETSVGDERASFRSMGRVLGETLPIDDEDLRPDPLTPAEEIAVDQLGYYSQVQDEPAESLIDIPQFIRRCKNKSYVKALSRVYGKDGDELVHFISDMSHMTPENNYEDWGDELRVYSEVLNCEIEDIAIIPMEGNDRNPLYYQLLDYINSQGIPHSNHNIDSYQFISFDVNGTIFVNSVAFGGFRSLYYCAR